MGKYTCKVCKKSVGEWYEICPHCGSVDTLVNSAEPAKVVKVSPETPASGSAATNPPPKKKSKLPLIIGVGALVLVLVIAFLAFPRSCKGEHEWEKASCTEPKTCSACGETEGEPLGHKWKDATCKAPKTCSVCGETEGELGEHDWKEADCLNPKTCSVCGETEGEAGGHDWKAADCKNPETCSVCGKTQGNPTDHKWTAATDTTPATCSVCGEATPMDRPKTGDIFIGKGSNLGSTLLVNNESSKDAYVEINFVGTPVYSFYIRAGESKHMPVPSGTFFIYLCTGTDWYGTELYFGNGKPERDTNLLDFDTYWYTYTISE